ncbi:LEAF RUST 10 DISEASE-RESISTANCE LOCUS RECEPTOR-LIKE PROTEIN KINASE-like 2.4 [Phragmites australis]|uniref:LEAF RUST 10 DISEASE-RESISTANCE LOCUS RECEPTOR-LIKE PROTEIN KINASE-like 2.4 n=1 Tax=Phragmites australis TaxID=29695 RepID=UPI002D783BFF|nr:LEAF RUST 10 DISEASE-RESISTANCE LOCUS RECEPTOR-LIKE PROTEIN KINASE-like 2.4 [Phragmites australis]
MGGMVLKSLLLALVALAIHHAAAPALAQTVQVWSSCSPANYTPGGAYDKNLRGMLKDLVTVAVSYGGYGNDTAGDAADQSYGLAICYADAPPEVCRLCLGMATGNVTLACPRAVDAAMMYNNCLLRYANASFLARPDMVQRFSFYNNLTRASDADSYAAALGRLMDSLAPAAAASPQFFAYGRTNITANQSLYGFTQCVKDLSPDDCRRCLRPLAASLPIWTRGGRAYSLTCYTRFEVVPFYMPPNTPTLVVAPTPPPESSPGAAAAAESRDAIRRTVHKRLALTVSTISAILLVMACVVLAIKIRKSRKFLSIIGINSIPKENIEELLENCGSLAPKRYKYSQLKEITRCLSEKIGEGGYGTVYKGTLPSGMFVAVKFLHDFTSNGEEFINEVISIRRTSHVNIATLHGFCLEGSRRALIYDYMPNGSLDKFIYADDSKAILGWDQLYEIAIGIARGLEYLHRGCNTRIIHFDIKPHNILLTDDFVPKIADFGLAKLCNPKESYLSMAGMRGTIGFIAPEVFARRFGVVSTKSDVYSYGMMLLEMVGGSKNLKASVDKSNEVYFPDWIYSHLAEVGNLHTFDLGGETEENARKMALIGLCCIQVSPMSRPTMSNVLEMFEKSTDQLEIPPKQYFYSAIKEDSSEQAPPTS